MNEKMIDLLNPDIETLIKRREESENRKHNSFKKFIRANSKAIIYLLLIGWVIASLFPFFWGMIAPLNRYDQITGLGVNPIPKEGALTGDNYKFLFQDPATRANMLKWLSNSLIYSILVSILNVFFNFLAGYALARIAFRGKKLYLWYMIAGMMVPSQITQIPQLIILIKFGAIGARASNAMFFGGIIFSSMTSASWVFMVRQFYLNIGPSTEEAGKLDGLSTFGVFVRVSLRQMVPLMATMFTLVFMASWNNFVMFQLWSGGLSNRYSLVAGLQVVGQIAGNVAPPFGVAVTLAATNITIIPILLVYLLSLYFQRKQVIEGEK